MAKIRTPRKLAKTMVRPSHRPGKARSLSHLFLESVKFSAIGGRKPARAITVPPMVPHVARAVPTLVIVDIANRSKLSWSIDRTFSSTSLKTAGSGCGDKAPLDAEKSRLEGLFRESEEREGVWKGPRMSEGKSSS